MNGASWAQRIHRLTSGNGLRAQLLRGGIGSLSVKVAHAILAFALAVALARTLGPKGYGVYSFALAIIMLAAIPAQVGVPQLVVRETAKAQANGNYGLMRGLWRWGNLAVVMFSALALAIVGGILWFTPIGGDGARVVTLTVGIALIPIIALANVRGARLRGLRKVVQGQLPESIIRPALLLLFVLIWGIWFLEGELTPQMAMGLYVIAALVAFAVGAFLLHKARPNQLRERPSPEYKTKVWRKAVIPLAMITGLQLINNNADIIILGIFHSEEEVGIYRAVVQTALMVAFGIHIIGQVIQPYLARFHEKAELKKMQSLIAAVTSIVFVYGFFVTILLLFCGGLILSIFFGASYESGWSALAILSLGKLFYSGMGVAWHVLNMSGFQVETLRVAVISVIANLLLNFLLIPGLGMEGAAVGTTVAFILFFLMLRRSARIHVGVNITPDFRILIGSIT